MKNKTTKGTIVIVSLFLILCVFSCSKSNESSKKGNSTTSSGSLAVSLNFPDLNIIKSFKKIAFVNEQTNERENGEYYSDLIENSIYEIWIITTGYPTRIIEDIRYNKDSIINVSGLPIGNTFVSINGDYNGMQRLYGETSFELVAGTNSVEVMVKEIRSGDVLVRQNNEAGVNDAVAAVADEGNTDVVVRDGSAEVDVVIEAEAENTPAVDISVENEEADPTDNGEMNEVGEANDGAEIVETNENGIVTDGIADNGALALDLRFNFAPWIKSIEYNDELTMGSNSWNLTATICDPNGDEITALIVGEAYPSGRFDTRSVRDNCVTVTILNETIIASEAGTESRILRATDSQGLSTEFEMILTIADQPLVE